MKVWSSPERMRFEVVEWSKSLRISASYTDHENSGSRGGEPNPIDREFSLDLTTVELEKLLDYAVHAGLLKGYSGGKKSRNREIEFAEVKKKLRVAEQARRRIEARLAVVVEAINAP
jgi:hypothetical protein